jgi:hypothetical protein
MRASPMSDFAYVFERLPSFTQKPLQLSVNVVENKKTARFQVVIN